MDWRDIMLNMGLVSPTVTQTNLADPDPVPTVTYTNPSPTPTGPVLSEFQQLLGAINRLAARVTSLEQRDVLEDASLHKLDTSYPWLGGNASVPGAMGNASMPGAWS